MVQTVLRSDIAPAGVRLVAIVLAWHLNDELGCAWPGLGTIASEAGITRDRVKQVMRELQRGNVVEIVTKGTGGAGAKATTRWRFTAEWVGKQATRVARSPGSGLPRGREAGYPGVGKQATPNRDERKATPSLSSKQRRSRAPGAPRGRTVAPAPLGETFDGVNYREGL